MAFCLLFIKSWSIAAPELQRQNCIIIAEPIWLTEPQVLLPSLALRIKHPFSFVFS